MDEQNEGRGHQPERMYESTPPPTPPHDIEEEEENEEDHENELRSDNSNESSVDDGQGSVSDFENMPIVVEYDTEEELLDDGSANASFHMRESLAQSLGEVLMHAFRRPVRTTRNLFMRRRRRRQNSEPENDEEETIPENAERFDTDLPAEHSYLGTMVRVSGVDYLEPEKVHRLMIFTHHAMVFPGETLPMIIPDYMLDTNLLSEEGLLFGVYFPYMYKVTKPDFYGVTCQIFEKGNDESGNVLLKSRILQRFIITKKYNSNMSEFTKPFQNRVFANVKILPEIYLPDPLSVIDLGSMNRFRDIDSMTNQVRRLQASTTVWPKFVYDQYNVTKVIEKAKNCLESYKMDSMPTDNVLLSFWLGRNLVFNTEERIKVFRTNSVNMRMQIIDKYLDNERFFCCRRCRRKIANCNILFAMSKHGVQSNYCNPSGFIHETNTVYTVLGDSVYPSGAPSTEFSWFPGYSWQIVLCKLCDIHVGWKFVSTKSNMVPKSFYGLSGINVKVYAPKELPQDDVELFRLIQSSRAGLSQIYNQ